MDSRRVKTALLTIAAGMLLPALSACGGGFSISGAWQVTSGSFGQAQQGAIIQLVVNGKCSLYSPADNCVYSNGTLSGTGLLGGNYSFQVKVVDNNHIELSGSGKTIALTRG